MKRVKLLLFAIIFLLSLSFVAAYTDQGTYFECENCSDCNSALTNNTYDVVKLNADFLSVGETCIEINALENKAVDCQGYTINGDDALNRSGIYVYNDSVNITVMNCNLNNFSTGFQIHNSTNSTFINFSSINNAGYCVTLDSSFNNSLGDFTCEDNAINWINFSGSKNNTFTNFSFYQNIFMFTSGTVDLEKFSVINANASINFSSLQDAIDSSLDGTIILLNASTFTENIVVNKSVTIVGQGMANTFIVANNTSLPVFNVTVDGVTITGLTVNGSTSNQVINARNIVNLNISDVAIKESLNGLFLTNVSNSYFTNFSVTDIVGNGIYTFESNNTYFNDFSVVNASTGINVTSSTNLTLSNFNTYANALSGVFFDRAKDSIIYDFSSYDNLDYGLWLYNSSNLSAHNFSLYSNGVYGLIVEYTGNSSCYDFFTYNNSMAGLLERFYGYNNRFYNFSSHSNINGLWLATNNKTRVYNFSSYDNLDYGVLMYASSNVVVYDFSVYNSEYGLQAWDVLSNSSIYNFSSYANLKDGLYMQDNSLGLLISNFSVYENNGSGINVTSSTNLTLSNFNTYANALSGVFFDSIHNSTFANMTSYANEVSGIHLLESDNNVFATINMYDNVDAFVFELSENNVLTDFIAQSSIDTGILIYNASNNTIFTGEIFENSVAGINITAESYNNTIYDVFFNNINNIFVEVDLQNTWNTSETTATNILGSTIIWGNAYAKPNGDGFSETCESTNGIICDDVYTINANNADYHALYITPAPEEETPLPPPQVPRYSGGSSTSVVTNVTEVKYLLIDVQAGQSYEFNVSTEAVVIKRIKFTSDVPLYTLRVKVFQHDEGIVPGSAPAGVFDQFIEITHDGLLEDNMSDVEIEWDVIGDIYWYDGDEWKKISVNRNGISKLAHLSWFAIKNEEPVASTTPITSTFESETASNTTAQTDSLLSTQSDAQTIAQEDVDGMVSTKKSSSSLGENLPIPLWFIILVLILAIIIVVAMVAKHKHSHDHTALASMQKPSNPTAIIPASASKTSNQPINSSQDLSQVDATYISSENDFEQTSPSQPASKTLATTQDVSAQESLPIADSTKQNEPDELNASAEEPLMATSDELSSPPDNTQDVSAQESASKELLTDEIQTPLSSGAQDLHEDVPLSDLQNATQSVVDVRFDKLRTLLKESLAQEESAKAAVIFKEVRMKYSVLSDAEKQVLYPELHKASEILKKRFIFSHQD